MFTLIPGKINPCIRLQDSIKHELAFIFYHLKCNKNRMNKPYSKRRRLNNLFVDPVLDQSSL